MLNFFRNKIAGQKLRAMHRYDESIDYFKTWFAEFEDINLILQALDSVVKDNESLIHTLSPVRQWVRTFRSKLVKLPKVKSKSEVFAKYILTHYAPESKEDIKLLASHLEEWAKEFNKKKEVKNVDSL